ncbi:hypothetical protein ABK040_005330 [Willaertia magna]
MKILVGILLIAALLMAIPYSHQLVDKEITTRGVPQDLVNYYTQTKEGQEFNCLTIKKRIPFELVNDDYCDCEDGSDEPGTNACSNSESPLSKQSKFFCRNRNYKPKYISYSKVNDGVCDCCDGSDENLPSGKQVCPNTCKELGKEIVSSLEKEIDTIKQALQIVQSEYINYGKAKYNELESEFKNLENEINEKSKKSEELKKKKEEMETVEGLEREMLREKKRSEMSQQTPEQPTEEEKPKTEEQTETNTENPESSEKVVEEPTPVYQEDEEVTNFKLPDLLQLFTQPIQFIKHIISLLRLKYFHNIKSNNEFKTMKTAAEEARKEFNDIENELSDLRNKRDEVEKKLKVNYGPFKELFKLSEQCFNIQQRQYTYEVCPFKDANQKENYSSVLLGRFKEMNDNVMKFEDGQHCWKVGARKAIVRLLCGLENKLVKVDEPSTCEYHLDMETPCACTEELLNKKQQDLDTFTK